jgi:hypothetical protein
VHLVVLQASPIRRQGLVHAIPADAFGLA